jgi:hypothetical protein
MTRLPKGEAAMTDWIKFAGKAEQQGGKTILTAASGNGSVTMNGDDVRIDGAGIFIRPKSKNIARRMPNKLDAITKAETEASAAGGCPGNKTYCIGLVLFCCANHEQIGVCVGAWDCS